MENTHIPNLIQLDRHEPILLDEETALVGHQGWFDGKHGDAIGSRVLMNDFLVIKELYECYHKYDWAYCADAGGRDKLIGRLREISTQSAEEARLSLLAALQLRKTVIFGTHFPPFAGACWHEGSLSDRHWMPWFTSGAMGEMLEQVAAAHPDHRILVLCGQTHSPGVYQHAPNLRVMTGRAQYGAPDPVGTFVTPLPEWLPTEKIRKA